MTLPWYLTAGGLYVCTVAAWFMYRYPMALTRYGAGGAGAMATDASPEAQRAFTRHRRCAHLGGVLLVAGFFLQLLGALLTALTP